MTKQQHIELVDIDIKLLRWVSEIVADGSEIRSLAGRSARLGDGTSRNPKNRDELLEQRSKDLEGMIGQVRGFDLDEFLSDWEPPGQALPWTIGNDGWVSEQSSALKGSISAAPQSGVSSLEPTVDAGCLARLSAMAAGEGVSLVLKVLYVPDYVPLDQHLAFTSRLYNQLSQMLPSYEVHVAIAEGPFEDSDGVGAHFEAQALKAQTVTKQVAQLKVDLHVSVVKLARHAALHRPRLIFGHGQGAVVAAVYGHPGSLEEVLASRNVQPAELPEIAQSWGNVAAILVSEPRLWVKS